MNKEKKEERKKGKVVKKKNVEVGER